VRGGVGGRARRWNEAQRTACSCRCPAALLTLRVPPSHRAPCSAASALRVSASSSARSCSSRRCSVARSPTSESDMPRSASRSAVSRDMSEGGAGGAWVLGAGAWRGGCARVPVGDRQQARLMPRRGRKKDGAHCRALGYSNSAGAFSCWPKPAAVHSPPCVAQAGPTQASRGLTLLHLCRLFLQLVVAVIERLHLACAHDNRYRAWLQHREERAAASVVCVPRQAKRAAQRERERQRSARGVAGRPLSCPSHLKPPVCCACGMPCTPAPLGWWLRPIS
jgi:hypothetical protein